jgi:hypothetical protein
MQKDLANRKLSDKLKTVNCRIIISLHEQLLQLLENQLSSFDDIRKYYKIRDSLIIERNRLFNFFGGGAPKSIVSKIRNTKNEIDICIDYADSLIQEIPQIDTNIEKSLNKSYNSIKKTMKYIAVDTRNMFADDKVSLLDLIDQFTHYKESVHDFIEFYPNKSLEIQEELQELTKQFNDIISSAKTPSPPSSP